MSVINKMLRDLDSRNARATVKKQGVHSVPPQVVRDRRVVSVASGSAVKVLGALLVLVLVAGGLWKFGVLSQFMTMQPSAAPVAPRSCASTAVLRPSCISTSSTWMASRP